MSSRSGDAAAGFGVGGVMASGLKSYVAVDVLANGSTTLDTFNAPHDSAASRRALDAAEGVALSLWRDQQLVGHWRRDGRRGFRPAAIDAPPARPSR